MGDTQTTKAAETTHVKQKTEDRPPHEREYAPSAFADATLFRATGSDDPTTPPQHLARVLRRLTAPRQTGFLLQCQRRYGNAYVQRLISSRDNGHSSPLKQEAHTQEEPIARQVTALQSGTAPDVATAYAEEASSLGGPENIAVQTEPQAVLITPNVQRQKGKDDEEDNPILTKSAGSMADSFEAGADVETQVSLSKGRGSPLPEPVRAYMEPRFGVDFNQVRVHTGSNAIRMNQAVGAQAFTVGRDIYYGAGKEPTDLSLTAHELTHVLQQEGDQPQRARSQEKGEAAKDDASSKRGKVRLNVLSTSLQREDTAPDHLASLNEMLDSFDIPEEEVISLLQQLTPDEKATVTTDPSYKTRMASAFDTGEMVQAVGILGLSLDKQLEWIEAATSTSSIDYSEIRTLVISAPQSARDTLKTSTWRDFFVGVCDNSTIITAVTDLDYDLQTQLEWIGEEASTGNIEYSQIQPLVTGAPQTERDALKTSTWRDFFVGVCDNSTIITAVTDLDYDLQTQLEWIGEEASTSNIEYSQIQSLVTGAPQTERDALKTNTWRDFFVGVCTNSTIITAVTDLDYDLQTQLEWIEEEASPSSLGYSEIRALITAAPQSEKDALKTNKWRDFFVGVCTNATIMNALDDLNFDLLTTIQWLLEEASISNVDFTWLCNRFKTVHAFPPGEETIACAIMERDIRDGTFNSSPDHTPAGWITRAHNQLLVATQMGGMVGETAKWKPSDPTSGTNFQIWASAPVEGPMPPLSAIFVLNCWEMVMLAAFRSGVLSWARIHVLYTSGVPDWFAFLVNQLSFSKRIPYDSGSPAVRPVAGDIVFFDGAAHIALATGSVDGLGRTQIYSFWPPPNTAFTAGGTIDDVKITTIEELNDYWVGRGKPAFKIEFATPNW